MKRVLEIRFHGRGGQGAVTAAEILAQAAFLDGKYAQAFPSFGVERRGAPVTAFCRISGEPIRLRQQIYNPEYLIIQDASLLVSDPEVEKGAEECLGILVNSERSGLSIAGNKNVVSVPATKIALEKIGKPFINTALLGAFAAMSEAVSLDSLKKAVLEHFGGKGDLVEKNVAAMVEAFGRAKGGGVVSIKGKGQR